MSHIKRISFLIRTKNKSLSVPFFTNQINYCVHARSLIRTNTKSFMIRGGASPVHCCQMTAMTTMISWDFHCKLMLIRELKPWRSTYDISGILAGSATGLKSNCAHGIGARRVVQLDSGRRVSIARVGSKWGGEKGLIVKKSWSKTSPKPCIISKYVDTTCRNYVFNG